MTQRWTAQVRHEGTNRMGKALVLLNGSNLLNLMEKHGHKAMIDLKEAKKIIAEQEKMKEAGEAAVFITP